MTSSLERLDTSKLYPPLLRHLKALLANCDAAGQSYCATTGYRDPAEQMKLWCQGRTQPGPIVTQAKPFSSAHQFGLAVDCAPLGADGKVVPPALWTPEHFEVLGRETMRSGLVWGGIWQSPDRPHVNWPGFVHGVDLAELKKVWDSSPNLEAVWAYVTAYSPTMPMILGSPEDA